MSPRIFNRWIAAYVAMFAFGSEAWGAQSGTVLEWGSQVMPLLQPGTRFTAIAAGWGHNLALKSDGTVLAWGRNDYGQSAVPAGLGDVVAIAAGGEHSLALKSDGTVVGWGDNSDGQSRVPRGLNNIIAAAAGLYHSLALKSNGTVVAWGSNIGPAGSYTWPTGQSTVPRGLSNVIAIAAGGFQ